MSNFLCKLVIAKQLILKTKQQNCYGSRIEKISELSKLLSVKIRVNDDLFHLSGKFGIGHLFSLLSLEKQEGASASKLILSLCLFRIVGERIHSICKHKIYELSNHGKNCFYRMMIRPQMDLETLDETPSLRYETHHGMAEALEKWNKVCGQIT